MFRIGFQTHGSLANEMELDGCMDSSNSMMMVQSVNASYGRPKVFTRKTAIRARVTGLSGQ